MHIFYLDHILIIVIGRMVKVLRNNTIIVHYNINIGTNLIKRYLKFVKNVYNL